MVSSQAFPVTLPLEAGDAAYQVSRGRLSEQTAHLGRQSQQPVHSQAQGVKTPGQAQHFPYQLASLPMAHLRTMQQRRLFEYCREQKSFISTHSSLSGELGIPYGTVRGILRRLKQLGLLVVTPYFQGAIQGLHIMSVEGGRNVVPPRSSTPVFPVSDTPVRDTREIDRSNPDLSISLIWQTDTQTIRELWPFAAQAGLAPTHLRQLETAFRVQGWDGEGVVALTLRYLDWQLEHGGIADQKGNQVNDPIAYWLCSMKRNGSYQRPKGYVDKAAALRQELLAEEDARLADERRSALLRREREELARDEELETQIADLSAQGKAHPLWGEVYPHLTRLIQQKVKDAGPSILVRPPYSIIVRGRLKALYGLPHECCPDEAPKSVGR